ncbi:(2Fe-2S)-binding protein [Virgibacillus alimentarius]|uniref:Carbon-monoxide dehydrogenase small subunit n=1 Tax=Virgibacillus alimentarius TaxID=698769 RepID=A0ABS4S610_9BACI|nr:MULTISPECIES: (2Fe-2S)-binding protein [Virgibacillus]MBP2256938.1 carbon-monoxide dehydrogenase small subunit [Virgibacillus alimentarius]HLR68072.1 (2Fe-2S)-binding protein [Virgibacillus sp.]
MKDIHFKVNGKNVSVNCAPTKTLLDVLRDEFDLTGSKECCGKGECGSCTVLLDGVSVCSCLVLIGQIHDVSVITVEGIGLTSNMDVVQQAFVDEGATQCGYCTPGLIVSSRSFLDGINHVPTDDEVKTALGGNLCRCTGYTKIMKAVQTAARKQLTMEETTN